MPGGAGGIQSSGSRSGLRSPSVRLREARGLRALSGLAVAALLGVHFSSFDAGTRPLITDVRYYVYYAWRVVEGDILHRDLFAVKTQLAVFLGAAWHATGEVLSVDPLLAIRVGSLGLAAVGGALLFALQRRIGRGRSAAGWLGLAAYLSFGLLGELPAIGNVPKLAMAVAAPGVALLVHARRFVAAGALAAVAFFDWQIGALAGVAVLASALAFGRPRRAALARVTLGGVLGTAPFLVYYAANGALVPAFEQVVRGAFLRGSLSLEGTSGPGPLERIANTVPLVCPGQELLFLAGLAGVALVIGRLLRRADADLHPLLLPMAIQCGGVLCFTAVDNQGYGDFFLLLHAVAFFLGVTWIEVADLAEAQLGPRVARRFGVGSDRATALVWGGCVLLALIAARPGPLRPDIVLRAPGARPNATLADQREVAARLSRLAGDGAILAYENAELLYLMRRESPVDAVYFNDTVWRHWAHDGEEPADTALRVTREVRPAAFLYPRWLSPTGSLADGYQELALVSESGRYWVVAHLLNSP